jgi:hypothetical protein
MKELIEVYELKLKNVEERLEEFKNNGSFKDMKTKERLSTKRFEYMAFLEDLRRACPVEEEEVLKPIYISKKIFYCLFKRVDTNSYYYYVRISSEDDEKAVWSMGYLNAQARVSLVGGDLAEGIQNKLEEEYKEYI